MKRRIHLICNAHLDPVWLWEWQEGAAETISTFRTAVEFCEKDEMFVFNHNESVLYEWIQKFAPELFRRIQKQVKQGRWHIMGGWYLQPDCNMASGESFVRQILAGRQYFGKHFNVYPTTAINFDPFGHSRGLVQILAKSGYTSYLFGRPREEFMKMDDRPFLWVGFDGSCVLGRRFTGWYNTALGQSHKQIEERIAQSTNDVEAILWGVGNHGGGPSRKDLAEVNALIKHRRDIEILHSTPDRYFNEIAEHVDSLPHRANDLNPWAIGCYTSMIRIKQKHRRLENELSFTDIKVFHHNRAIPAQVEREVSNLAADWRKRVVFRAVLEPGQMNRFDCTQHRLKCKPPVRLSAHHDKIVFRNDSLEVHINTKTGLMDRYCVQGVDYVRKGAFCPVVLKDNEDPWETRKVRFGKSIGKFKLLNRQMGTQLSGIEAITLNSVRVIEDGPVRTVVEAILGFKESFICQRYLLPRHGSEVQVTQRVFWNQKNRMLKLLIPLTYVSSRYLGQTAFGVQELPTRGNEAVAPKWVVAADDSEHRGFNCINDGIYGSDMSGQDLHLSLLRFPAYSGHPIGDNEILPLDRFTPRIDQGQRLFNFWFNAGPVDERLMAISAEAQSKNEKPYALSFFPKGNGKNPKPMVLLNNPAIELSAVKKAESNSDWIIRLFNTTDRKQMVCVKLPVMGVQSRH